MGSGVVKNVTDGTAKGDRRVSASPQVANKAEALPAARRRIRLDRIIVADRLRPCDQAAVANIAVSMQENGQITPLVVRPVRMDGDEMWFGLVAGGHRYDAAKLLGWTDVDCSIRDLTDDQARLVEIDENLVRRDLTAYERALFIDARLDVWAALHPERVSLDGNRVNMTQFPEQGGKRLKAGRPSNADRMSEFLGDTPATMGFRAETAADLGISETTVKRALAVARGLSKPAHALLATSKIGRNEGLLRQIAGVADKGEQLKVVEALTDGRAKKFADALVIANGRTPVQVAPRPADEALAALKKLWRAAPATHRKLMVEWLASQPLPGDWTLTEGRADD